MINIIKKNQYTVMPWKNGQGTTAEICKFPPDEVDYQWRLSQATVGADGPFSFFKGKQRCLVVFKGEGLLLNETPLLPLQPLSFSGELKIESKMLGGVVEDLGLIYDPNLYEVSMDIISKSDLAHLKLSTSSQYFYYILNGHLTIGNSTLELDDTIFFDLEGHQQILNQSLLDDDFKAVLGTIKNFNLGSSL